MLFNVRKLAATMTVAAVAITPLAAANEPAQTVRDPDRTAKINETMGLVASSILRLDLRPGDPAPETIGLIVNGVPLITTLTEHSVRAADYRVLVQLEDGSLVEAEPSPVQTLRGQILGVEGAIVTGSMEADGLRLRLILPAGDEFWIEPLQSRFDDAAEDEYVMYHISDVLDCRGRCGIADLPDALAHRPFLADEPHEQSGGAAGGGISIAELAADADYEYYLHWGSSVSNVQNRINSIVNTLNAQYENQTGLTHQITTIIVRTSSNQPYTQTHAENLLNQFRNHWNANHGNIQRDMAHLFTGKSLNGNTIGIAWLGVVCNLPWAYGLSQSDFSSNFACVTDLTAHELGHNWNAPHCSCPSHTMNPSITCANNFHSSSINTIVQFADSLSCLDAGGGGSDPGGCPAGEIEDCNGNCAPASWVGDGICDDGSYTYNGNVIHFDCEEFNCDGGDCNCNGGDPDPDPPADPVSMSVSSISLSTVNVGQGNRKGQAVVTIVNDLGQPVQGATVTGSFTGAFSETHSATTNSQGQATLQTNGTQKGNVKFTFCVTGITHSSLNYAPGDNTLTCNSN